MGQTTDEAKVAILTETISEQAVKVTCETTTVRWECEEFKFQPRRLLPWCHRIGSRVGLVGQLRSGH